MFEIGSTLRDARVRRDISLQQAEDETKIRVKYIQAMENEDFEIMPGGTYVKGFLRTYAEYLGLDYQLLLDEYNDRYGTGEHKEHIIQSAKPAKAEAAPRPTRSPRSQKNRNYILVAALAVAIIAVLAYLGWGNSSNGSPTLITTTGTESTPTSTAPAATETRAAPTQTQPATLETLEIASTSTDNWVEVHRNNASGEVIWGGTLSPGQSKSLSKVELNAPTVVVKVGSAVGLQITVNGKPQTVPEKVGASYVVNSSGMTAQG